MSRPSFRYYLSAYWKLALLVMGLAAAAAGYLIWQDRDAQRSYQQVQATITGFGMSKSKWQPGKVWVAARTSDGVVGEALVPTQQLAGCNVGGLIPAERLGIVLKLKPAPCK